MQVRVQDSATKGSRQTVETSRAPRMTVTMEGVILHPVEEKNHARAEGLTKHFISRRWHFVGSPPPHLSPPCASCVTKAAAQGALRTLLAMCNRCKLIINTPLHGMDWGLSSHIFF